jgi:hypothetical protein
MTKIKFQIKNVWLFGLILVIWFNECKLNRQLIPHKMETKVFELDSFYAIRLFTVNSKIIGLSYLLNMKTINCELMDTVYKQEFKNIEEDTGRGLYDVNCTSCHYNDFFRDSVIVEQLQVKKLSKTICNYDHSIDMLCREIKPIEVELISEYIINFVKRE